MRRSLVIAGMLAVCGAPLAAQGSGVMTHGSCATAMGASGVAHPCEDGSAVLFNPGAIGMQRLAISAGWTGITTSGSFTYDLNGVEVERPEQTSDVPFLFATGRVGKRFAVGFGAFAPYGLRLEWPGNFSGRFTSYQSELKNVYLQPTIAMQAAPWLSFGAGLDYVAADITISQRVDLATTALPAALAPFPGATFGSFGVPVGTDFADVVLSGDATGIGFNLGGRATFMGDRLSLGVRYMSEVELDYDGDANFRRILTGAVLPNGVRVDDALAAQFNEGAALGDQGISTSLTLPAQAVVGVAFQLLPNLRLQGDYQWTGWDSFDQADVNFENETAVDQTLVLDYQNTDTWRLGAEFKPVPALALRAGFIYNTAAEKDFSVSPLLPEAERNYYSVGAGYRLGNGLGFDVGYQHIDQSDRRGRVAARRPDMTQAELEALNVGVYSGDAHVLNFTVSYRPGGR
ncbi:MAG TPA: outer membrane protein transport protein [Longimicrobium sp.]|nr:outer membrane protein transport protein [Longimicrobium sp.]